MKKIKKNISVYGFLCVLFCSSCNATFTGKVVSETEGIPLENITLVLQNYGCAPSIVVSTKTDKDGNFELEIPDIVMKCLDKKVSVYVSSEKYKADTYDLNSKKGNLIKLPIK